jgi:hypothetical protein
MSDPRLNGSHLGDTRHDLYDAAVDELLDGRGSLTALADPLARPAGLPGYLHEVWTTSNAARDEHFARVIIDLVRKNERVFAVCGSSHAVKLEPALRAALNAE